MDIDGLTSPSTFSSVTRPRFIHYIIFLWLSSFFFCLVLAVQKEKPKTKPEEQEWNYGSISLSSAKDDH